jgi:hypothetical protein
VYVTAHRPTRLCSELEEVGAVLAHGARAMISARARALRRPPAGAASPSSPAREECMPRYIGLDLHKRILEVCVLNEAGAIESRHRLVVSREALRAFAQSQLRPDDRLAVEATTNTGRWQRFSAPSYPRLLCPTRCALRLSPKPK